MNNDGVMEVEEGFLDRRLAEVLYTPTETTVFYIFIFGG